MALFVSFYAYLWPRSFTCFVLDLIVFVFTFDSYGEFKFFFPILISKSVINEHGIRILILEKSPFTSMYICRSVCWGGENICSGNLGCITKYFSVVRKCSMVKLCFLRNFFVGAFAE